MRTTITKLASLLLVMIACMSFNQAKAQNKYSFATYEKFYSHWNNDHEDAYYLFVSNPVENWFSLSKDTRADWERDFRTQANKKAGFEVMTAGYKPTPYRGEYERFTSLSECKEAIQDYISDYKKEHQGLNKPIKVIYINL
uniref:hypothetical protein n=1 Tax=Flavobacterium sp. TaxID=239 RepID=UPI004049F89D